VGSVLLGRGRRRRGRRPRLALVTPWPPEESGIADYGLRLTRELARTVDVDVFVRGPLREYEQPIEHGVTLRDSGSNSARRLLSRHDRVLYCMGNSRFHGHVYELLRRRPGAVVLHDVQLTGFFGWYAGSQRPEDPVGWLAEQVEQHYGTRIPAAERQTAPLSWERRVALGIYMSGAIQRHAQQVFVHSRFARDVAERDGGILELRVPVTWMPFGMPDPRPDGVRAAAARPPLVVHVGVVSEVKGIAVLMEAFARVCADHPGARLVIAGPADPSDQVKWSDFAAEHAPNARIELPGHLDQQRYETLLSEADLAVQLRRVSNGEASGAICDCLAAGLPTIVTDLGWTSELPRDAVVHTAPGISPELLAVRMEELIADTPRRTALSAAALRHAGENSFERVAAEYLETLGLS
jgi:glycosyltransferase involved in cell wall biosynthesis